MAFYENVPTTRGTGRVAKAKSTLCSNGSAASTASTASIDLATTASKHCPRSAPRLVQLVRAFLRLSLVQTSNRLSSPVSLCGTRTREWPESSSELSRLQGPTSAATGSSSLIGPVRAKQCSNHSGENPHRKTASRSAVHSAAASFSPVL